MCEWVAGEPICHSITKRPIDQRNLPPLIPLLDFRPTGDCRSAASRFSYGVVPPWHANFALRAALFSTHPGKTKNRRRWHRLAVRHSLSLKLGIQGSPGLIGKRSNDDVDNLDVADVRHHRLRVDQRTPQQDGRSVAAAISLPYRRRCLAFRPSRERRHPALSK